MLFILQIILVQDFQKGFSFQSLAEVKAHPLFSFKRLHVAPGVHETQVKKLRSLKLPYIYIYIFSHTITLADCSLSASQKLTGANPGR